MKWQALVALRYLSGKQKEKFISVINLISILGVAVGVGALIIVISVMSGFDEDLKDKIIGTYSHIEVISDYGIKPSEEFISRILKKKHVVAASFFLNTQALIRQDEMASGIVLKGIEAKNEIKVNKLGQYMVKGSIDLSPDGIVIGSELAKKFNVDTGDLLTVVSSAHTSGKKFKVCGIFTSGMYEYDMNLAYVDIARAQELMSAGDLASGVMVKVDDAMNAIKVKRELIKDLGPAYTVRTWIDLNKNFLEALKLEKTVMFLILTLIVMVACFNIASALIMIILEKTKDIGILKAIGASNRSIMSIFALQGFSLGAIGTMIGSASGLAACWALKTYKFITLPKDIYYIDKLPVKISGHDVAVIILSSLFISLVSTIYPSYRASKLDPVEALRYE